MTKKEVETILKKGRLPLDGYFWYNSVFGTFMIVTVLGFSGAFIGTKLGTEKYLIYFYILLLIFFVAYKYWQDEKMIICETAHTKEINFKILESTLNSLNWSYTKTPSEIILSDNKYILMWVTVKIIPFENIIMYNFQYNSYSQCPKFAFFIGIRTYLRRKFEQKLYETLVSHSVSAGFKD